MWRSLFAIAALAGYAVAQTGPRQSLDLNGSWEFRLDPRAAGEREQWYSQRVPFSETILVPGCWQAQGFGQRSGILRHDYSGPAWYRRAVAVPASWRDKRVTLRIGGALRITDLFVNGASIGTHDGMSAPFAFDVTGAIRAGTTNIVALRVTNPGASPTESPDKQAGTVPTGTLNYIGNWGGIYGRVELEATARVWVDQVWVRTDLSPRTARFGTTVHNAGSQPFEGRVRVVAGPHQQSVTAQVAPGQSVETEIALAMPGARLWSPDDPHLYTAAISVLCGDAECDRVEQRFGLREITARGNALLLNGRPLYLRGYGDDNVEVISGVPPASKDVYLERLRLARSFGFNAVRFHSMTPLREFFEAADEAGILVMAELPVAYTQYLLPNKEFLRNELKSVALAYRNHPSWLSLAFGNEFNLDWIKEESARREFLDAVKDFYSLAKSLMPDRMVLSNDGYRMEPTDMLSIGRGTAADHPTIRHEFGGYYCSLPDVSLIPKFSGVMAPNWLAAKQRWVEENGLTTEYPVYVGNSQRLVQLGRKFQIERVRREQDITGYEYWLITDYPGGTGEGDSWEEGWFDFFWHPKGITPTEGREINSAVLPLIDSEPSQRTLWADDSKTVNVLVSNYGDSDVSGNVASWRTRSDGGIISEDRFAPVAAAVRKITPVGTAVIGKITAERPQKIELTVDIGGHTNHWSFWTFPRNGLLKQTNSTVVATADWPGLATYYPFVKTSPHDLSTAGVWITPVLNGPVLDFLRSGGRVWLALNTPGKLTFFPASGGALGTVIDRHPALDGFPHEGFADLQFYNLIEHATPFPMDALPNVRSIMGGIRTKAAFLSKSKDLSKVGYIFEAKIGAGRLLVTTLRIGDQLDDAHPEAVYLFDRLIRYCDSDVFQPRNEIAPGILIQEVAEYLK